MRATRMSGRKVNRLAFSPTSNFTFKTRNTKVQGQTLLTAKMKLKNFILNL